MSENNNMFNTNSSLLQLALPRPEFAIFEKVQKRICINFVKCSIPDVWGGCEFAWGPEYTSDGSEYGSSSEYAKALYKPGFWIYQTISLVCTRLYPWYTQSSLCWENSILVKLEA